MYYATRIRFYLTTILVLLAVITVGHTVRQLYAALDIEQALQLQVSAYRIDWHEDEIYEHPINVVITAEEMPVESVYVSHMEINTDTWEKSEPEHIYIDGHRVISMGYFTAFAYCICIECTGEWSYQHPDNADNPYFVQRTASGTIPIPGRTIAAPPEIPFGTELYITGLGWRVVEDRGGAITEQRLDILKICHETALQWGVQEKEVFVRE